MCVVEEEYNFLINWKTVHKSLQVSSFYSEVYFHLAQKIIKTAHIMHKYSVIFLF